MKSDILPIDSPERMISAIRRLGIVPLFKNPVTGWSIEESTAPGCWFGNSDEGGKLGPWDWKIDAVREGDIAYGKFIGNRAAFATVKWYVHLMNWRRSIPKYRMAVGDDYPAKSQIEKMVRSLSPTLLKAIKEAGSLESKEIRDILKKSIRKEDLDAIGGNIIKYLTPEVKKQAVDYLIQYLDMGTWTITGDFTRVYRGANLEYCGWQRSSFTTPDALFGKSLSDEKQPFWVRFVEDGHRESLLPDCTPTESHDKLISHIQKISGSANIKEISKMI